MMASAQEQSTGKRTHTAAQSTRKTSSSQRTNTTTKSSRQRTGSRRAVAAKKSAQKRINGQRAIDDGRATQIQTALIRSGYMTGTPSGHWDDQTEAAMQKYQSDNGWQTKLMPDSRAIIKLGLGPEHSETAAASSSATPGPSPATQP